MPPLPSYAVMYKEIFKISIQFVTHDPFLGKCCLCVHIYIYVVPSYLNDGLTSIKFPRGKTLELYGRISLPPAK